MKKRMWKTASLTMLILLLAFGSVYAAEDPQAVGILAYPSLPDFGTVTEGEISSAAQTITVWNMNSSEVTLNQPDATYFTVGVLSGTTVESFQTVTFTLAPDQNLPAGTYTEKIIVTATDERFYATVTASVVVEPAPVYAFELLPEEIDFGKLTEGYDKQTGVVITVRNTGDQTLTFEQPTSSSFGFDGLDSLTLEPGDSADVRVFVTEGLNAGEYTETIVIAADGPSYATVTASVIVEPVPVYAFDLLPEEIDFGELTEGYNKQTGVVITVRNTGDQTLTFEQPTSSSFGFDGLDGLTLEAGDSADVRVFVTEGLNAGGYTETIVIKATKASAPLQLRCEIKAPVLPPQSGDQTPILGLMVAALGAAAGMLLLSCFSRERRMFR